MNKVFTYFDIPGPRRIQRSRQKGFVTPPGTIYVGRNTIWGNPFKVEDYGLETSLEYFKDYIYGSNFWWSEKIWADMMNYAEKTGGWPGEPHLLNEELIIDELKGKNLSCWCALDKGCHADILLKIANEDD